MGSIVSDTKVENNQGGRVAGAYKDDLYIRIVEVHPANVVIVRDVEGVELYREDALARAGNFNIRSIDCLVSSFTHTLILVLGGFDSDTGDSRVLVVATTHPVRPPRYDMGS